MKKKHVLYGTVSSALAIGGATFAYWWMKAHPAPPPPPPPSRCDILRSAMMNAGRSSLADPSETEVSRDLLRIAELESVYGAKFFMSTKSFPLKSSPTPGLRVKLVPFAHDFPLGSGKMPLVGYRVLMTADEWGDECQGKWFSQVPPGFVSQYHDRYEQGFPVIKGCGTKTSSVKVIDVADPRLTSVPPAKQTVKVLVVAGGNTDFVRYECISNPAAGIGSIMCAARYYWVWEINGTQKYAMAFQRNKLDIAAEVDETLASAGASASGPTLYLNGSPVAEPTWINDCPVLYAEEYRRAKGHEPSGQSYLAPRNITDWETL